MNRRKIVLIGAGSAIFTQGLVADLIHSPELGPYELGLVDIDEAALNVAAGHQPPLGKRHIGRY